jgi:ABC-type transport system substrate-binding protein
VVFSLNRAMSETSDFKELLTSIVEVRAVDDYTVEIRHRRAEPASAVNLTNLIMMDKGWAEANGAVGAGHAAAKTPLPRATPTAPGPTFWSAASPMCAPC